MSLFKIKTKKDKKIEQLEKEVEWLKVQYKEPMFITDKRPIVRLCGEYRMPDEIARGLSQDHIKQILVRQLADKLSDYIEIIRFEDYARCQIIYRGEIDIMDKGGMKNDEF